jgi:hypothetical protein
MDIILGLLFARIKDMHQNLYKPLKTAACLYSMEQVPQPSTEIGVGFRGLVIEIFYASINCAYIRQQAQAGLLVNARLGAAPKGP